MKKTEFIKTISNLIKNKNLSLFLGAGVSIGSGFLNWKELMSDIAEDLGLDIDKEDDMISIAQYHLNKMKNRNKLNQKIMDVFSKKSKDNKVASLLCELPIESIWTTNYDKVIESNYENLNKIIDVKIKEENLTLTKKDKSAILYKIHGDVENPSEAIITRDDYERFDAERGLFKKKLIYELSSNSFLFVGYSFSDPNFQQILSKVRISLLENKRNHYYITRKEIDEYEIIRQKLKIVDLEEYGIRTLLVDDYNELEDIFTEIKNNVYWNNIFISGSAVDYSEFGTVEDAKKLIKTLISSLIEKNYKIINGHGLGVGEFVVQGIVEGLSEKEEVVNDAFELKVFPQNVGNKQSKTEMWTALREYMISQSRVMILMFGNKLVDGKVELANGMQEEFEIALKHGLMIIPVISTGKQTKLIYDDNKSSCSIDESFKENDIDKIINSIIQLIESRKSSI